MSKQERRRVRVAASLGLTVLMSSAILGGVAPLTANAAEVSSEPTTTEVSPMITAPENPSDSVGSLPAGDDNGNEVVDEASETEEKEAEDESETPTLNLDATTKVEEVLPEQSMPEPGEEVQAAEVKLKSETQSDNDDPVEDTWGSVHWTFEDGVLTLSGGVGIDTLDQSPWSEIASKVTKVQVIDDIIAPADIAHLFQDFTAVTAFEGLDKIDTSNVTDMLSAFANTGALRSIDVSGWDVSSLEYIDYLFEGSGIVSLDLSSWSTNVLTYADEAFGSMPRLEYLNISNLHFSESTDVFDGSVPKLRTLVLGPNTPIHNVPTPQTAKWLGENTGASFTDQYDGEQPDTYHLNFETIEDTWGSVEWRLENETLYLSAGTGENTSPTSIWAPYADRIQRVEFEGKVIAPKYSGSLFAGLHNVTKYVNLGMLDVSQAESLSGMFSGNSALSALEIGNWDTSQVKYMAAMFSYCNNLTDIDIENWTVHSLEDISAMFTSTGFESLDLSKWHFRGRSADAAFREMRNLKALDISNFDLTSAQTGGMLQHTSNLTELTLGDKSRLGVGSIALTDKLWQGENFGHQFSLAYDGNHADTYHLVDGVLSYALFSLFDDRNEKYIGWGAVYGQPGSTVALSSMRLPAGYELENPDETVELSPNGVGVDGAQNISLSLKRVPKSTTRTIEFEGLPEGHFEDEIQEIKWDWGWPGEGETTRTRDLRFFDDVVHTAQSGYAEFLVPEVEGYEADVAVVPAKTFDAELSDLPEDETFTITYTKVDSEDGGDQNPDPTPSQPDPDNGSGSGGSNGNGNTGNGSTGTGSTGTGSVGGGQLTNLSTGGSTTTDQNQALPQTGSQVASGLTLLGLGLLGLLGFTKRRKRD